MQETPGTSGRGTMFAFHEDTNLLLKLLLLKLCLKMDGSSSSGSNTFNKRSFAEYKTKDTKSKCCSLPINVIIIIANVTWLSKFMIITYPQKIPRARTILWRHFHATLETRVQKEFVLYHMLAIGKMAPMVQEPEIQFAQRLASNEKPIRTKAIKKLRKYLRVRSQKPDGKKRFQHQMILWRCGDPTFLKLLTILVVLFPSSRWIYCWRTVENMEGALLLPVDAG